MAGNIKGITIEFRGETTKLETALKTINKETRSVDSELRKVNNAIKFNPTSIDLWRQKQTLLTTKIQQTEDKLKILKDEQKRMDAKGVDKNSKEYRELQREIITSESKLKNFKKQLKQVGNVKLRVTSEKFKQLGTNLTKAGQAMAPFSKAAGVAVAALGALAVKSGQDADELNTLSKKYHIGTAELQKYSAAADLVDVDVETLTKAHTKLTRTMSNASNGNKKAAKAFSDLGIKVTDANGNLRDSDAVFQDAITALGKIKNPTERDAKAMELFGKAAADLNPLIEDGGEAYTKLSNTLKKYDLDFIDQETLDKANEFNDDLDTMKAMGTIALQTVGSKLAGYLLPAMAKLLQVVGKISAALSKLDPAVLTIIGTIAALVAATAPVLLFLGKISFAISAITGLAATLGISLGALVPIVLIVAAVIAALVVAGVLLYKNWDKIKATAKTLMDNLKKTFNNIKKNIIQTFTSIKARATSIWNALRNFVTVAATLIKNAVKTRFDSIKKTAATTWDNIKTKISNVVSKIKSVITNTFSNLKTSVKNSFNKIKDAITHPIESARKTVDGVVKKIKGLFPINIGHILKNIETPKFSLLWGEKDFGKLGKLKFPKGFDVSWHADGGIFASPTIAGIGEAGPEAVVPLDKLWDKLDAIAEGAGQQITINVYPTPGMDVRELAAEVERRLINSTKNRRLAWQ